MKTYASILLFGFAGLLPAACLLQSEGLGPPECTAEVSAGTCSCSDTKCTVECAAGGCVVTAKAKPLVATCDGGDCSLTCPDGRNCDFSCDGGACDLNCAAGATCEMSCNGGGCLLRCDPQAEKCTTTCAPDDCVAG